MGAVWGRALKSGSGGRWTTTPTTAKSLVFCLADRPRPLNGGAAKLWQHQAVGARRECNSRQQQIVDALAHILSVGFPIKRRQNTILNISGSMPHVPNTRGWHGVATRNVCAWRDIYWLTLLFHPPPPPQEGGGGSQMGPFPRPTPSPWLKWGFTTPGTLGTTPYYPGDHP